MATVLVTGGTGFLGAADLLRDGGWREVASGADYVPHIASPFPGGTPADEDELIVPARDGALRVLRAARDGGVKRLVLTSSFAAVGYGRDPAGHVFTEDDWTRADAPGVAPYIRSKAIAERAAWDFVTSLRALLAVDTAEPELLELIGELHYEKLLQPETHQLLVAYHADPGTDSAERLQILASL